MDERRADELKVGDLLELHGDRYVVLKAKVRGKSVHLRIDGRRGTFDSDVKAKTRYRLIAPDRAAVAGTVERVGSAKAVVAAGSTSAPDPLHSLEAPGEPSRTREWDAVLKDERVLVAELGAKLVGVEVEGGKLIVPPVTDTTIFGHLLTMHRRRYDGVTFEEARAWAKVHDPAGPATAVQTMDALSFQRAMEIHDELHRNFAALPTPHWHRERAPR